MSGAEYSPEHSNTTGENQALVSAADSYLERVIEAQERGGDISAPALETASRFYEDTLTSESNPAVLVKDALCLDGLAEIADEDDEAAHLRAVAAAEVKRAWEAVGGAEAPEEHLAPILVMEAKLAAEGGDRAKARDILTRMNGRAPAGAMEDLDALGTLKVSTVAKALLGKEAA
jgi:hypothetical protein